MKNKQKKMLFVFYGLFNLLITNIILQLLLISVSTFKATLLSQTFNLLFGFYNYGKKVFDINVLKKSHLLKFLILHIFLWNINWSLIDILSSNNLSKNISSLLLIIPLACLSYFSQRFIVFKK